MTVRIGLGCLRLEDAVPTLRAAVAAGVSLIDTARVYPGSEEAIAAAIPVGAARIVTKCGMRPGWVPDGRASTILADARASVAALGRAPDLLLLHVPDPGVDLARSARALARARDEGLAHAIGLSNVTRGQIERVAAIVPVLAVEDALGARNDAAARGGVVAWCKQNGALFLAHSPLGGPTGVPRLRRDSTVRRIADRHRTTPETVMLAYLLALDDAIVPLVGARTTAQLQAALAATEPALDARDLGLLDARFPGLAVLRRVAPPPRAPDAPEVVILMGIPGAGKSRLAADYVARGYLRLNRDELGGTLKGIAIRLGSALAQGARRVVLDNTYVARPSRSDVVRVAGAAGARVRCVHIDISLADAQRNVTQRMLEHHGVLLGGRELVARKDPGLFAPPTLFHMERDLERPGDDEGFAAIETIPFVRATVGPPGRPALFLPVEHASTHAHLHPEWPLLVFGWGRHEPPAIGRPFELSLCEHGTGAPTCWCRPPLPGLLLDFARRHAIDLRRSALVAQRSIHVAMAESLGVSVVRASGPPRGV